VRAAEIEAWTWSHVDAFLRDSSLIAAEIERRQGISPDPQLEADLEQAQRDLTTVERRQERILSLFAGAEEGQLPVALVQRQLAEAEQQKQQVAARLAVLKARQREQAAAHDRLLSLQDYCERVGKNLDHLDWEGKRLALEALGVVVVAAGPMRDNQGRPGPEWRLDINLPLSEGGVSQPPGAWA
jgi:hypothetical protein